jgi:phosphoribosyl-AMP cyclohydrolase
MFRSGGHLDEMVVAAVLGGFWRRPRFVPPWTAAATQRRRPLHSRRRRIDIRGICPENLSVMNTAFLDVLKFDSAGLLPVIVQDHASGQVLMQAYANREAILRTLETGKVHTYSRSRGRLALKGESSGHFQLVKETLTDCDGDVVLFKVEQLVAACHEGYRSCFYRRLDAAAGEWRAIAGKVFDPGTVYQK